jgi:hypothetical protein
LCFNDIAALEALVESLRSHQERLEQALQDRSFELARCRAEILHQQETISDLRSQLTRAKEEVWNRESQERTLEIQRLREEIARLEQECIYLRGCVEKGLASIADAQATSNAIQNTAPAALPPISRSARMTPVLEVTEPITSQLGAPSILKEPSRSSTQEPAYSRAAATAGDRTARETIFIQVTFATRQKPDIANQRN